MKTGISVLGFAGMLVLGSTAAHAAIDDAKAKELMKAGGCGACHSVKTKIVGPAFKDVAAKRKAEPDAIAVLAKTVRSGSKGTYGPMPMPATAAEKISDADLHDLIEWILTK